MRSVDVDDRRDEMACLSAKVCNWVNEGCFPIGMGSSLPPVEVYPIDWQWVSLHPSILGSLCKG